MYRLVNVRRLSGLIVAFVLMAALLVIFWLIAPPAKARASRAEALPAPLEVGPLFAAPVMKRTPAVGEPLPRIVCPEGYEAFVYATGLSSPHGLGFSPDGRLYVAEEWAGRVSRIESDGSVTPVVTGLTRPEGITFDPAGNLYVVEDVQNGRLLRVGRDGEQTVLTADLDAPEDIVWSPDGHLYIVESNVQFAENVPWDVLTGVTRISQDGAATDVVTDTLLWSYSAIALGADGLLYVGNEASNVVTTDSVFRVDPTTGDRTLFASDLTAPEGLALSPGGFFPLYVTEENLGDGHGRLSIAQASGIAVPLCTGFSKVQDVVLDPNGNLYVSEDTKGLIVQIIAPDLIPPNPPQNLVADPLDWTASNAFTVTWENPLDTLGIVGAYLKIGDPPAFVTDATFFVGEELTQVSGITVTGPGAHPVHLWLEDGAGNTDHAYATTTMLRYDPDPPGSPVGLAADPGGWGPTDSFTLTWTNPPDASGVMTACFRLGAPPVNVVDLDGCQAGADIDRLAGVTASDNGELPVYLWLADLTGNTDPATAASTILHHDGLPPVSVASAPTTALAAPIRVTWVATDTHSGVETVTLWVKIGDGGTWTDSGLSARAEGPGFFLYEPAGEGVYYFATLAVDQAANAEAEPIRGGDARTLCQTWQRVYVPLVWKDSP